MMRRSTTIVLFALAACGQQTDSTAAAGVTLPTDAFERAQACTAAAMSEVPGSLDGRLPSARHQEWGYYALLAAKARHGDAMTYDHVVNLANETLDRRSSEPSFGNTRRAETLAACRTAYPAAGGQAAVTLPADADEAVLQCAAITRVWRNLTRDQVTDLAASEAQAQRISDAIMGELERISAGRHVETDQEAERVLEQALARSVGLGRPDTAINACERRFVRAS